MYITGFKKFKNRETSIFKRINESSESELESWYSGWEGNSNTQQSNNNSGGSLIIAYDDSVKGSTKTDAERFRDEVSKGTEEDVKATEAMGANSLGELNKAMTKRKELDSGALRLEDGWYFGKGAWRINSNKIVFLNQVPAWMSWEDPLHDDIMNAYWPDLLKGETTDQVDVNQEEEEESSEFLDDLLNGTGIAKAEPEYAMAEGLKYITEQDEFTLGPPKNLEDEASVVNQTDLIEAIVENYERDHRANMMIWGAPGIGKTEVVKQAAGEIGKLLGKSIPVYIVTLAQMQPYDLNGIPLAFKKEGSPDFIMDLSDRGKIYMDFAIPAWLPGEGEESEGILFFDEINRADPDVMAAALTLLLDRKAQKYEMPPGWRIIAAGNRAMDGPVKQFEAAVGGRFLGGHVHLVPSVDNWIDWARSPLGYYKDINGNVTEEFFIPDEFIMFLKQIEKKPDAPKFFDLDGNGLQTEFKEFYRFDKQMIASGGEGVAVGYPSPRSWAISWKNAYSDLFTKKEFYDKVSPDVDPKKKAISAFEFVLQDVRASNKLLASLTRTVGRLSANAFMKYAKIFRRHSDSDGTLNEKLANIFKNPGKPRPLVDIPPVKDVSERFAILGLVQGSIDSMEGSFGMKEFINWTKWLADLKGKVSDGELASHASSVIDSNDHTANIVKKAATAVVNFKKHGKAEDRETALAFKPFAEQFREILNGFNI